MFKRILVLLILSLLIQPWLFISTAHAADICTNQGISWDPKEFPEGQSQYEMNFTISDATFPNLNNKYVRLIMDRGILNTGGTYTNPPVKVDKKQLSFTLTGNLATATYHNGILQTSLTENGNYEDSCNFTYQVGIIGKCSIAEQSIPSKIPPPPDNRLAVAFVGKANTEYFLKVMNPTSYDITANKLLFNTPFGLPFQLALGQFNNVIIGLATQLSTIPTGPDGQGTFPLVSIPGQPGNTNRLIVIGDKKDWLCYQDTTIDLQAPVPVPAPIGSVLPIPAEPGVKKCGDKDASGKEIICAKAGGDPCGESSNPGFKTAIGCIHTNPAALVRDVLTFAVAISGGLAFLMMLLGVFQMLTSAGNPDTLTAGKDKLTNAIIGLLFIIFSVMLMQIIGFDILRLPDFGR